MGGFMPKKSYKEKLKNPRWQKKRLEVMERDVWSCQECKSKSKTLNVHHVFYEYGKDPWDYPTDRLVTLCEDCHKIEHDANEEIKSLIKNIRERGFSNIDLLRFFWTFKAMFIDKDMFIEGIKHFSKQTKELEIYLEKSIKGVSK